MKRISHYFLLVLLVYSAFGCRKYELEEKYKRPDWLAGKVYTQVKDQPELSTFARCIELTGYDTILDVSGSYTVFAPNNEAFSDWFQKHPQYGGPEDVPISLLRRLVKYHIVQNPWSKQQLRSLDIYGWIDTLDLNNNEPKGYKRETLLLEKNWTFGITAGNRGQVVITDTLESNWYRKVATDSRKYAPVFYKEYFDIYDLTSRDFEFYFERPFGNANDMYYAGGKIIGDEIFAENGFVYNIDRVIDPLPNAYQILGSDDRDYSYKDFLKLLYLYPEFTFNRDKTLAQPGAELGLVVDSLFDLTFPELPWDIENERTSPPTGTTGLPPNVTIRYHHGLVAPTDQAFRNFISNYFEHGEGIPWGSLDAAPDHIKRIVANSYLSIDPVYPTNFENGYYNGQIDLIRLDEADIVDRQYASNCTFIGVDNAIVPRAFKAVTGPVYLQRGYSFVMYSIERSGLLPALKREGEDYAFYVESDANCHTDSSLLYYDYNQTFALFQLSEGSAPMKIFLGANDLRTLLLNHIGTRTPTGLPRKEFIKNRAGNYIIVNNQTGEVSGTAPTRLGYQGAEFIHDSPTQLSTNADNGITYDVQGWFSFSSTSLFNLMQTNFPRFHNLIRQAGLSDDAYNRYNFISDNEIYTVFAPTDSTLNVFLADTTLTTAQLKQFCLMHFIQGAMIFTDGSHPPAYYETVRRDETSTEFVTVFSKVYIDPGIDVIRIPDSSGGEYTEIVESPRANRISAINLGTGDETFLVLVNNAVVHPVDRVFIHGLMDTR